MKPQNDIYKHDAQIKTTLKRLESQDISDRNKDLIRDFDRVCFLEALSKPRRLKIIRSLVILARDYLKKDFDRATKDDIKDVVVAIDSAENRSPWTKHGYKAIIKKFYRWLKFGDEYRDKLESPPIVSWLRVGMKRKDQPKIRASDILTESETKRIIEAAETPRDRAFVSMLYELGARIGEIGSLRIRGVTRDEYGYLVDLEGKTGHRTPRIVISDSYLTQWLNMHPSNSNPDSPLWVMMGKRNKEKAMTYGAFRALVKRIVLRAGITKRVYPHLFRHTRVTHLLLSRQINEAQAKVYFGWLPSSTMLSEYSHLISKDANDAILAMHGIKTEDATENILKPKQCPRCGKINSPEALFCQQCTSVLDVKTALELDEKRQQGDELMTALVQDPEVQRILLRKIMDKGLAKDLLSEIAQSK